MLAIAGQVAVFFCSKYIYAVSFVASDITQCKRWAGKQIIHQIFFFKKKSTKREVVKNCNPLRLLISNVVATKALGIQKLTRRKHETFYWGL